MHSVLMRQIKRAKRSDGTLDIDKLLGLVDLTYQDQDRDRRVNDHALTLLQSELEELNQQVRTDAEARVNAIMDNVGEAIIVASIEGIILRVNAVALEIFGYQRAELIGSSVFLLMAETERRSSLKRLLATRQHSRQKEMTGRRRNGEIFPVEVSIGELMLSKQGKMFVGIIRDISIRKRNRAALQESERRFRDLVSASSDWFWEMGPTYSYTYVSPRITEKLGVSPSEMTDHLMEWVQEASPTGWEERIKLLDSHEPFRDFQFEIKIPGHPIQTIRSSGIPIFDTSGQFQGYRGTANNITEELSTRKRAQNIEHQFLEAIEVISDAFALYDSNDRLIICNNQYKTQFGVNILDISQGDTFEHIVRYLAKCGIYGKQCEKLDRFIENRLAEHANPTGKAVVHRLSNGRWIVSKEFRTRAGGVVAIRTDVNELKNREEEVEALKRRYELILQSAGDGIIGVDAKGIITFANPMACRAIGLERNKLEGLSCRTILRDLNKVSDIASVENE